MLLLDSLYINTSGGKILLDYLVEELEKNKVNVFYLFDKRVEKDYQEIPAERKVYLKASIRNRWRFYKNNKQRFSKIFCFGNMPPFTKQDCEVITYFHQPLYLKKIDKNLTLKKRIGLYSKKKLLHKLRNHADYWYVQLPSIQQDLSEMYKINKNRIKLRPFYPPIPQDGQSYIKQHTSYLYVSSGATHKNQIRLLNAFCKFYDETKSGRLTLTISDDFPDILQAIIEKQKSGYPINNLGYIKREELYEQYQTHQFLIFPSLAESFGLGIVEAIENGCQVIGADLKYMHDVCKPSILFDPYSEDDIYNAFKKSLNKNLPITRQNINNQIKELLQDLI